MYAFILRTCLNILLCSIFFTNKDLDRTRHNVCYVVTQKIKLINFFPLILHKDVSQERLLTEAAVASSLEEQIFKHGSSNHAVSVPALSGPRERGFLGACEPLQTTGMKWQVIDRGHCCPLQGSEAWYLLIRFREVCCLCEAFVVRGHQGLSGFLLHSGAFSQGYQRHHQGWPENYLV